MLAFYSIQEARHSLGMSAIISVRDLVKSFRVFSRREGILGSIRDLLHREYRTLAAVNGISFDVKRGDIIGFIGPNGAGKSTTIKMLTGILKPSAGQIAALELDPYRNRKEYSSRIGVVFGQRTQLWWDIAVIESFRLLGKIYRVPQDEFSRRLSELSEVLQLEDVLHTPVRKLSLGQRLRSDLAASLLHNPPLLFLDEPTIGVDAVAKLAIRGFLRHINARFGTTIILTTHDLVEIEELCERIIIIDRGKLIFDGALETIKNLPGLRRRVNADLVSKVEIADITNLYAGRATARLSSSGPNGSDRAISIEYDPAAIATVEVIKTLVDRFEVADISIHEPEIEDILIKIYNDGHVGAFRDIQATVLQNSGSTT